jgi:hypothetical protein
MDPAEARDLWHLLETVHAVTYFAPSCRSAAKEAGFRDFWMGYFACRSAPLGAADAGLVTATFANFEPTMVQRAIPEAWELVAPEVAIELRAGAAADALRQCLSGDEGGDERIEDAAERLLGVLDKVIETADPTGRPMFAANRDVIPFEDPVADMWQMCTTLREHRGDGHVAVLVSEGLGGCEPHVLAAARRGEDPEHLRAARGWSEQAWGDAVTTLTGAGLLADGALTEAGRRFHDHIEDRTDELAAAPYVAIGEPGREALRDDLIPLAAAVAGSGWLPFPNPIGLPDVAGA